MPFKGGSLNTGRMSRSSLKFVQSNGLLEGCKLGGYNKRVTLRDIAEKTGFSANTVSLALRNSDKLTPATGKAIRKAAADLNYFPNLVAQSLVSSQSWTIGLVLTDIMNPILTEVAQAIGAALHDKGYSILFATSSSNAEREAEVINTFRSRQVDGLLVFPVNHSDMSYLAKLRAGGFPVVSLVNDPTGETDCVALDEKVGVSIATKHLIDVGHRKIAFLDAASGLQNTSKRAGYRQALDAAGISGSEELEEQVVGHGIEAGYKAFARLWDRGVRPTAVMVTRDATALGIMRWCHDFGISVPDQLSIVGFDNTEQAKMANVPLTSVNFPVGRISAAAVDHLLSLVESKGELPAAAQHLFKPELVVRKSTCPPTEG
ncbi:MAG: LacI family DNA-binding transcriptional regulator [Rhodobacteraceae bacterium]|nr:LacI family DNA-binding transcriptional regulator [Paracoccaceae bacterium]